MQIRHNQELILSVGALLHWQYNRSCLQGFETDALWEYYISSLTFSNVASEPTDADLNKSKKVYNRCVSRLRYLYITMISGKMCPWCFNPSFWIWSEDLPLESEKNVREYRVHIFHQPLTLCAGLHWIFILKFISGWCIPLLTIWIFEMEVKGRTITEYFMHKSTSFKKEDWNLRHRSLILYNNYRKFNAVKHNSLQVFEIGHSTKLKMKSCGQKSLLSMQRQQRLQKSPQLWMKSKEKSAN